MNKNNQDSTAVIASRHPLEIELLVPSAKRVSVAGHHVFREGLRGSTDDDIDALVEDLRQAQFEGEGSRP